MARQNSNLSELEKNVSNDYLTTIYKGRSVNNNYMSNNINNNTNYSNINNYYGVVMYLVI